MLLSLLDEWQDEMEYSQTIDQRRETAIIFTIIFPVQKHIGIHFLYVQKVRLQRFTICMSMCLTRPGVISHVTTLLAGKEI